MLKYIKENAALWFGHVTVMIKQKQDASLRAAWSKIKTKIKPEDKVMWNRVNGLMANVIATLYSIGWQPQHYHLWTDRKGDAWNFLPGLNTVPVIIGMLNDVTDDMWREAATHRNGKGLENGVVHNETTLMVRKFSKQKSYSNATALETILCDGC